LELKFIDFSAVLLSSDTSSLGNLQSINSGSNRSVYHFYRATLCVSAVSVVHPSVRLSHWCSPHGWRYRQISFSTW